MTETTATIVLNSLKKIGPVRVNRLLKHFGSAKEILKANTAQLEQVENIGRETATAISNWQETVNLDEELRLIDEHKAKVILPNDKLYPQFFKHLNDPPILLYCIGEITESDFINPIAIVGSRRHSLYAGKSARKLAFQLSAAGITIISGLARGIDTTAHEGALAANGRTIAIVGSGLANIYPKQNHGLAKRIAKQGAVISEFPMAYPPDRKNFPIRNRLISAWSAGTLVAECGAQSGSLITANLAAEQGKMVFAIPGQIDNPGAIGTNRLIQDGAKLVMDSNDILEELHKPVFINSEDELPIFAKSQKNDSKPEQEKTKLTPSKNVPKEQVKQNDLPQKNQANLSNEEKSVMEILVGHMHIDQIIQNCTLQLPPGKIFAILSDLEIKNLIKQLPGKIYTKSD